ncbi:Smr/MutS family protein [Hyphobacterium sp.]|uniref:Smr/MutS family protein n=1 Tax=Hyphobacterium sp. TaxID=2004662 RepID=UPI003B51E70C
MKKRVLRPEERQIWRQVTRSVMPLDPERPPEPDPAVQKTPPAVTGLGRARPVSKPKPEKPRATPPPQDRSAERRLRRGRIEVDARIDLHGMTQAAARTALGHFLHGARSRGFRCVLVITGKGKSPSRARQDHESAPGILKRRFPGWLAEPELRHLITGYAGAHRRHGGDGAFYVLIRAL